VAVAVEADRMSARRDLRREGGVAFDLLADEEEGRSRTAGVEEVENGGRAFRMRAVVERESYARPVHA
jgi:hypothetical protein